MAICLKICLRQKISTTLVAMAFAISLVHARQSRAQDFIPGSGRRVMEVGDDFEAPKWNYIANLPKSSQNIDGQERLPGGVAANGRWFEPMMRGAPDIVRLVQTPPGGIAGSKGAMLMQTLWSGVPGRPSFKPQQDDFVADVASKIGMTPVSRWPSVVVKVYLPPFDKWEKRTGNSFGYRACCHATKTSYSWGRRTMKDDIYWPGMFICFYSKADSGQKEDSAQFIIRANEMGQDVAGPRITKPGWYSLGMSFGPNGQVNYYIHEGVENFTAKDHVASYFAYSSKCEQFESFFFDLVNMDDGHSWSTQWIVDDAFMYIADGTSTASTSGRRQ
ncbi:MAG TPA: hypothetical protein VHX65_13635 [Pirellulales bacterium]|nr:hypothetical protein [Pirellulales bacterium]